MYNKLQDLAVNSVNFSVDLPQYCFDLGGSFFVLFLNEDNPFNFYLMA